MQTQRCRIVTRGRKVFYYYPSTNIITQENEVLREGLVLPIFEKEEPLALNKFRKFTIELTQQCNLRCKYCCYSGIYNGRRVHNNTSLKEEQIAAVVDFIVSHHYPEDLTHVNYYGGEALLEYTTLIRIIGRLNDLIGTENIKHSISTNGLLLTGEKAQELWNMPNVVFNVSFDGVETIHNNGRLLANGEGTFDKVCENLSALRRGHGDYLKRMNLLVTIPDLSYLPTLAREWGKNEPTRDIMPSSISTVSPNFDSGICETLDFTLKKNILYECLELRNLPIVEDFIETFISPVKERGVSDNGTSVSLLMGHCFSSLDQCFISANGNIAPCESCGEGVCIGTITTGIDMRKVNAYVEQFMAIRNSKCRRCWAIRFCAFCMIDIDFIGDAFGCFCKHQRENAALRLILYCEYVGL